VENAGKSLREKFIKAKKIQYSHRSSHRWAFTAVRFSLFGRYNCGWEMESEPGNPAKCGSNVLATWCQLVGNCVNTSSVEGEVVRGFCGQCKHLIASDFKCWPIWWAGNNEPFMFTWPCGECCQGLPDFQEFTFDVGLFG